MDVAAELTFRPTRSPVKMRSVSLQGNWALGGEQRIHRYPECPAPAAVLRSRARRPRPSSTRTNMSLSESGLDVRVRGFQPGGKRTQHSERGLGSLRGAVGSPPAAPRFPASVPVPVHGAGGGRRPAPHAHSGRSGSAPLPRTVPAQPHLLWPDEPLEGGRRAVTPQGKRKGRARRVASSGFPRTGRRRAARPAPAARPRRPPGAPR